MSPVAANEQIYVVVTTISADDVLRWQGGFALASDAQDLGARVGVRQRREPDGVADEKNILAGMQPKMIQLLRGECYMFIFNECQGLPYSKHASTQKRIKQR